MLKRIVFLFLITVAAHAQVTRSQEIEGLRDQKARALSPEEPPEFQNLLEKIQNNRIVRSVLQGRAGLRPKFGGLATGAGFAFGPEFFKPQLLDGLIDFRAHALISTGGAMGLQTEVAMPRLAGERAFVTLGGAYVRLPRMPYYGPGPDSAKTGRSNFLVERTTFDVRTGIRPFRYVTLGASAGYLLFNVGEGRHPNFISAAQQYSPAVTPGIQQQTNYIRTGGLLQFDYRDDPNGARAGGNYFVTYDYYSDRKFDLYSFRRVHGEVQQYLPFLNKRRVIALRLATDISDRNRDQIVPFYLQPTLGGSDILRGYRPFRFYGDHALAMTAEYRWESFAGLDMALFYDRGKVFSDLGEFDFTGLRSSYGFGFRFNARNRVFLRMDTGFSREGFQVWLKFDNVF